MWCSCCLAGGVRASGGDSGEQVRPTFARSTSRLTLPPLLDGGVIAVLDGEPLSTLELSLATDDEYERAIQAGLEAYGRGPMDFDTGDKDFGEGSGARNHADSLWKSRRKYFAVHKRHRFTLCSPEAFAAWKKDAENNPKISVNCDPEEYRDRFYPVARRDGVPCDISMTRNLPWGLMGGVYSHEYVAQEDFHVRWTSGAARLQTLLFGQPRDVVVSITLRGAPSAVTNRNLTVTVNDRRVAEIVSPSWEDDFQTIELAVEASNLKPGYNVVDLKVPTWQPSKTYGTGDDRELGVQLASMNWRPREEKSGNQ